MANPKKKTDLEAIDRGEAVDQDHHDLTAFGMTREQVEAEGERIQDRIRFLVAYQKHYEETGERVKLSEVLRAVLQAEGRSPNSWAEANNINPNTARVWFASNSWPRDVLPLVAKELCVQTEAPTELSYSGKDLFDFNIARRVRPRKQHTPQASKSTTGDALDLALSLLDHMDEGTELIFDIPPSGPYTATNSRVLAYLFEAISHKASKLSIYSNEPGGTQRPAMNTRRSVALLFLVCGLLEQDGADPFQTVSRKGILEAAQFANAVLDGKEPGRSAPLTLSHSSYDRLRKGLFLCIGSDDSAERFNPFTFMLVKVGDAHARFVAVDPDMNYVEFDSTQAREFEKAILARLSSEPSRLKPYHFDEVQIMDWTKPPGASESVLKIGRE